MPHFGLIDEQRLGPEASELLRARLHIRSARKRLADGLTHEGMSTMLDALQSSLRWYAASPERLADLGVGKGDDMGDERVVCAALKRKGIINQAFDLERVTGLTERMLVGDFKGIDPASLAREMEYVMESLGVIPFDESELPPMPPEKALKYVPK